MTDQIPADDVREIIKKMHYHANHDNVRGGEEEYVRFFAKQLDDLLPPRPTLADTPPEERAAFRWMQADVADHDTRYVIANPHDRHGEATLIAPDGQIEWILPEYVTPCPDLSRMTWPGDQKVDPAPVLPGGWRLADHKEYGRVIVTRPEPDCDGEFVIIRPHPHRIPRTDTVWCDPGELTFLEQGADQ